MQYISTNRRSSSATFREAVLNGQPDDKGLYFPVNIPGSDDFVNSLRNKETEQIAFEVMQPYVGDSIPDDVLYEICSASVDFTFPLVEICDRISALELFHGPTLAFKDVGARFMSRCLQYFTIADSRKTIVIVATSGDTGGAVAAGFHGVDGVEVVILYPKGKVSRVQELQLTTLGGNVITLEVHGTFDDCQRMAKQALSDHVLSEKGHLTSANSINIARWLPQQFYYLSALKQWDGEQPIVSVPSGNFGNLAAGILAKVSGLQIEKFIAACNANDTVPEYIRTGKYEPKPSVATLSNAMDVGDPSNFVRILEIVKNQKLELNEIMEAVSISDGETAATMRDVFDKFGYVLDPHGAVGYRALDDYVQNYEGRKGIFLETAHPVKFDSVIGIIGKEPEIPQSVNELFTKQKQSIEIPAEYESLKEIITKRVI